MILVIGESIYVILAISFLQWFIYLVKCYLLFSVSVYMVYRIEILSILGGVGAYIWSVADVAPRIPICQLKMYIFRYSLILKSCHYDYKNHSDVTSFPRFF